MSRSPGKLPTANLTVRVVFMLRSVHMKRCWHIWCAACWKTVLTPRLLTVLPTPLCHWMNWSPIQSLAVEKLAQQEGQTGLPHPKIPLPRDLYGHGRDNSAGLDLANEHRLASLSSALLNSALQKWQASPMLEQSVAAGEMSPVINPAEPKDIVGYVREATPREVEQALERRLITRQSGLPPPAERAAILHRAAVLMESQMQQLDWYSGA